MVQREQWVKHFLNPSATDKDRSETLEHYHVSHVLLQRETAPIGFLAKISKFRMFAGGYRLYTLKPGASGANPPP